MGKNDKRSPRGLKCERFGRWGKTAPQLFSCRWIKVHWSGLGVRYLGLLSAQLSSSGWHSVAWFISQNLSFLKIMDFKNVCMKYAHKHCHYFFLFSKKGIFCFLPFLLLPFRYKTLWGLTASIEIVHLIECNWKWIQKWEVWYFFNYMNHECSWQTSELLSSLVPNCDSRRQLFLMKDFCNWLWEKIMKFKEDRF